MEIYLVYRYFADVQDSCVVKAFASEVDAMNFKEMRSRMIKDSSPLDYFYITPILYVK